MTETFDSEAFVEWLDEQDSPVTKPTLVEEWPQFPWQYLGGVTGVIEDGEFAYYRYDLRRAAKKRRPID